MPISGESKSADWLRAWARDWGGALVLACLGYVALYAFWHAVPWGTEEHKILIGDLAIPPVNLAAAVLAWRASTHRALDTVTRRAWRIVGLAYFFWFVGNVLWFYYEVVLGTKPFPSWADAAYLAFYPTLLWGLLALPMAPRSGTERLKFWLDAGTVLLGAGLIIWYFGVRPTLADGQGDSLTVALTIGYAVGDLVLLLAIVTILLRRPADLGLRNALGILVVGLALFFSADLAFLHLTPSDAYEGGDWPDLLWQAAVLLMAISAHYQHASADAIASARVERDAGVTPFSWLPYLAVASGYGLLLFAARDQLAGPLGGLIAGAVALTALVIVRQVTAVRENVHLLAERAERRGEARFKSLVQHASDVILIHEPDGTIRYQSPSARRTWGYDPGMLGGRGVFDLVHPEDRERARSFFARVKARPLFERSGGDPSDAARAELRLTMADGSSRDFEVIAADLTGDESIAGIVATYHDVTDRKRALMSREFLYHFSAALSESLDLDATLDLVASMAVGRLANWCSVHVIEPAREDASMRCPALVVDDPSKEDVARDAERLFRRTGSRQGGILDVIATGQTRLYRDDPDRFLDAVADDDHHAGLLRDLGCRSAMIVPLIARGKALGAMVLVSSSPDRRYGPDDAALAEEVARRAAIAVDNAYLYEAERATRAEAEALARLIASVAAVSQTSGPAETAEAAVRALPALLGGAACTIALPRPDGRLSQVAPSGDPRNPGRELGLSLERYVARAFAEGTVVRIDEVQLDPTARTSDDTPPADWRAVMVAPLLAHERTLGVLTAGAPDPYAFKAHHEELLRVAADHVATALAAAQAREEAARAALERAAILEQMADAVLVADAGGRIILANHAVGALLGVAAGDLLGRTVGALPWRILDEDGRELTSEQQPLHRALHGETLAGQYRVIGNGDRERWVWASAAPLRDGAGIVYGAVAVARDVTHERAQLERAAQSEKLRALGQLAGGVAHDLNQCLGLIAGHGDLAERALDRLGEHVGQLRESLAVMTQAAMDGGETVRRLLAFARPQQQEASKRVDMGDLLREVEKLTAPRWRDAAQAQGRPIALRTEAEDGAIVSGDPSGLREALTNLVFNAIDAMPDGGGIRLTARRRDGRVEVEVADSGVGMSEAVKRRIFEPFFTTKGERGSGLGLSMVFGIIRRHGGDITVESAPGRGTAFRLSLPEAARAHDEAPVATATRATVARRILVVDDELRLATMAAKLLSLDGHATVVATSGEEALDLLACETIDLVLTDLGLGEGMNGWDVADQVRHRWPGLPVILVTGWGAEIDEAEARAKGVAMVLAKPYRAPNLRRALALVNERP